MKLKSTLLLLPAMLAVSTSFGQYKVTTNGQKYTLVEESTGPGCGYCPDGAQDIEQSIEGVYPRAVIASWHDSYYDGTNMVVAGNPFSGISTYVTGDPTALIDRYPFGGSSVGQSRPWESYVSTRNSTAPKFDVSMKCIYNPTTKLLTVTITGKALSALTGTWNINAYVTEDSISSAASGYQQHSYLTTNTSACNGQPNWFMGLGSILPAASYSHMNVVRAILCTGGSIFGETAFTNPASGATFTKTYTYTIDTTISVPKYMKVIGLVQKPGPASLTNGNIIENAILAKVRLMPASVSATGVAETEKGMADVTVYPVPAKNVITVKGTLNEPAATKIEICNSVGQVVLVKEYAAGGSQFGEVIEMNNIANGTYFMNIYNGGEKVTKQFVVNK